MRKFLKRMLIASAMVIVAVAAVTSAHAQGFKKGGGGIGAAGVALGVIGVIGAAAAAAAEQRYYGQRSRYYDGAPGQQRYYYD